MSSLRDRISGEIADRYVIERELGRGGMASVYLAQDLKHKRPVALKVLHEELAAAVGADRFLREIEIAARLQHPHILPLHDSGRAAGTFFYVMPFVDGESLRDRLTRERQLSVADAVAVARDVADALEYAHRHGVVHRDIKPENILLSGGHAIVADFGVARAITQAEGASPSSTITEVGLAIGTPAYMSPEQAAGAGVIDGRTDIYALACVLFECLTGAPPFTGPNSRNVLARQMSETPPDVRSTHPGVSPNLSSAIRRALAKEPEERFAGAAEFNAALEARPNVEGGGWAGGGGERGRWKMLLGGAAGIAALLVAALLVQRRMSGAPGAPARMMSIAVMPFRNISPDRQNDYFAQGMTEELIGALTKIPGLRVLPRSSSFSFRGDTVAASTVGRRLHVDGVIEGSVDRSGNALRLHASLVRAADDSQLWHGEYTKTWADAFSVQDALVREITTQLRPRLDPATAVSAVHHATQNIEAYDLYLQGRYLQGPRTRAGLENAVGYFKRAVAKDSTYALAYSGLADSYWLLSAYGETEPVKGYEAARDAAHKALALDSLIAPPHASLGFVTLFYSRDWKVAEREFDRALAIDSTYILARVFRSWLYAITGRQQQSLEEIRFAQRLEPFNALVNTRVGSMLYYARQPDTAIAELRHALSLDPTYALAHTELAHVFGFLGQPDSAAVHMRLAPEFTDRFEGVGVGFGLARAGRVREARQRMEEMLARMRSGKSAVDPTAVALMYCGLGMRSEAEDWLERAFDAHDWAASLIAIDPMWDALRDEPRFRRLAGRAKLR